MDNKIPKHSATSCEDVTETYSEGRKKTKSDFPYSFRKSTASWESQLGVMHEFEAESKLIIKDN